jgi:type II secretory ATPase GspE/PulE/Tfp pilus assembly ATPase PilB-like protein
MEILAPVYEAEVLVLDELGGKLGYKGRIGIYEVLPVTEAIQELILKEAAGLTIKKAAIQAGMLTMVQDGLLKAVEGITDVEEVFRVAGE